MSNSPSNSSFVIDGVSYEELFKRLDKNGDGKIDFDELMEYMSRNSSASSDRATSVRKILDRPRRERKRENSSMNFEEFANYIFQTENQLRLIFHNVDADRQGKFDYKQLIRYFRKVNIELEPEEAKHLVKKMDKDRSLEISFDEWRSFFINDPTMIDAIINDPSEMLRYWRDAIYVDLGETPYSTGPETSNQNQLWWKTLIAGGIAGAVSRTATAPFDRLKIIMQYLGSRRQMSVFSGYRYLINEGGVKSLWRGNGVNVLKIIPETALRFAFYEETKKLLRKAQNKDQNVETSMSEKFLAGSIAGFLSQTVIYPLDVLKVRLCLRRSGEYSHWSDAVKKIYKIEGAKAFWRGYVLNQVGIIPYAGFDLACYETLKRLYTKTHDNQQPPIHIVLACGATSSFTGQLVTYPISLLRTRRQGQIVPLPTMDQSKAHPLLSAPQMIREIWKNEGFIGFYRGIVPNMFKVIPAVSISYLVYETALKVLQ